MLIGAGVGAGTAMLSGNDPLKGAAIGGAMGGASAGYWWSWCTSSGAEAEAFKYAITFNKYQLVSWSSANAGANLSTQH